MTTVVTALLTFTCIHKQQQHLYNLMTGSWSSRHELMNVMYCSILWCHPLYLTLRKLQLNILPLIQTEGKRRISAEHFTMSHTHTTPVGSTRSLRLRVICSVFHGHLSQDRIPKEPLLGLLEKHLLEARCRSCHWLTEGHRHRVTVHTAFSADFSHLTQDSRMPMSTLRRDRVEHWATASSHSLIPSSFFFFLMSLWLSETISAANSLRTAQCYQLFTPYNILHMASCQPMISWLNITFAFRERTQS